MASNQVYLNVRTFSPSFTLESVTRFLLPVNVRRRVNAGQVEVEIGRLLYVVEEESLTDVNQNPVTLPVR